MVVRRTSEGVNPVPPPPPRKKSRLPGRLLLFAAGILVGLGIFEVVLRQRLGNVALADLYEVQPGDGRCVALRPAAKVTYTGWAKKITPVEQEVNGLGYRGPERAEEKSQGTYRIAALGDSFTYGQGVAATESMPARIELALAGVQSGIEVLNFGVPGYNLDESTAQFEAFAARWHPDLALLFLFDNDLEAPLCDSVSARKQMFLFRNVFSYRWAYMQWRSRLVGGNHAQATSEQLYTAISRLRQATQSAGAQLAVVLLDDPLPDGTYPDAAGILSQSGIPYLDRHPWLAPNDPQALDQIPGEGHFTAEAAEIAGTNIAQWLAFMLGIRRY